jgi:hypothetical protein
LVALIGKLYTDVVISFDLEGETVSFSSTSGVKQGDVLAPTLFLYVMQAVLDSLDRKWMMDMPKLRWQPPTLANKFRGKLVGNNWKNKGEIVSIKDVLHADGAAIVLSSRQDLIDATTLIVEHFKLFGLQVHVGERNG